MANREKIVEQMFSRGDTRSRSQLFTSGSIASERNGESGIVGEFLDDWSVLEPELRVRRGDHPSSQKTLRPGYNWDAVNHCLEQSVPAAGMGGVQENIEPPDQLDETHMGLSWKKDGSFQQDWMIARPTLS